PAPRRRTTPTRPGRRTTARRRPPGRDFTTQTSTRGAAPRRRFMEVTSMSIGKAILASLRQQINLTDYRKTHWEGGFEEYLDIVREHPEVTRTAYQRLYDMILSHGTEEVFENKEKVTRYKFFTEFASRHADAIYGLDRPLMQLVNTFKSAAKC